MSLAAAQQIAHIGSWEWDVVSDSALWSDETFRIFELQPGNLDPHRKTFLETIHPDDRPRVNRALSDALDGTREYDLEYRICLENGKEKVIHALGEAVRGADGRPLLMRGTVRDITDRRRAEEERAKLSSAVEQAGDGIFMLAPDRCLSYVNPATCKIYGFTREELIGSSPTVLRSDVHPPSFHDSVYETLESGKTWSGRQTRRRKDGSLMEAETTMAPVFDASGTLIHYVGVERDITERLRLESQLLQAQKMEAIGTLAGGVAHDFNNILTVIMGLGNVLQMSFGPDDPERPHVDQIVASSRKAADLVQSLLAFSRKQRITLEPHKVYTVVASTAKLLGRLLTEDIALKIDLTDKQAVALLDVAQIDQVLMNLATNARDAMPNGGSLTIGVGRARIGKSFIKTHGFGREDDYVKLSVSDTGTGMDEKTLARIFDPFFTTKEVGKGTGLGLSSVYGIVKQHNGYITVTSEVLKGTTFDIYLPLVDMNEHTTISSAEVKGGTETILVLEDDTDVRRMMVKVLSDRGYVTMEAANGDDAIRVFNNYKDDIDLVILDVVMPGKNGKEVFDEITSVDPGAKAIFMSGYTGDVVIDKGVHEESVDFLQKPLSVEKLLAKVREVLER
jgi:PAS domain S-box-containing protein